MEESYPVQGVQARDIEGMMARITPEVLKCRSSVLHALSSEVRFILTNGGFFCRFLVGDSDSGKTLISRFLLDAVDGQALKLYTSCKMEASAYRVAVRILRSLLPSIPGRGLSLTELVDILLEALDGKSALIVLDDADLWLPTKSGEKLLARLSEAESVLREKQGIYLLLTLKSESPLGELRSVNPLKCAVTKLERYSHAQLMSLLENASEKVLRLRASKSSLRILAEVASVKGLKCALLVLLNAASHAEEDLSTRILPRHVKRALAGSSISTTSAKNKRVVALRTVKLLLQTRRAASMKELLEACNEALKPNTISYTQLWRYVRKLSKQGLVSIKTTESGRKRIALTAEP